MEITMEKEAFIKEREKKAACIEEMIKDKLPRDRSFQKTIIDAMEYSVMAGGKRLRPMLMGETYALFGGTQKDCLAYFMAAMEMIHTYSLVHDDLPAMDNDDYRRGRKTTHKVYGEDMGILAGDALLNFAYETAVKGVKLAENKENALDALDILAKKAGVYGMVGGQVVDVEMTGKTLSEQQLDYIYCLKTGALLEASLMVGATLAGASQENVSKMEKIGRNVGMAFQIQDDILDLTSTTQELGKPVGSDEKNQKTTYVTIYGMDKAVGAVETYSMEALETLDSIPQKNPFLNTLIRSLVHRKK